MCYEGVCICTCAMWESVYVHVLCGRVYTVCIITLKSWSDMMSGQLMFGSDMI